MSEWVESSGVERSGVEWSGVEWSEMEWSGVEWSGVELSGVEWSGVEFCPHVHHFCVLCFRVGLFAFRVRVGLYAFRARVSSLRSVLVFLRSLLACGSIRVPCAYWSFYAHLHRHPPACTHQNN